MNKKQSAIGKAKCAAGTCGDSRADLRSKGKANRKGIRGKLRGAAAAVAVLAAVTVLSGCATGTPSSKAQTSKACGNVITVNLNIWPDTNAMASAGAPGNITITLSDLIGTQVQSADAGGDESTTQTAAPANTSGLMGDKPIETIADVGKTAITGGASKVLSTVKDAVSGEGAAKSATAAAAGCTTGNCSDAVK